MLKVSRDPVTISLSQSDQDLHWDGDGFARTKGGLKSQTLKIDGDHSVTSIWERKQGNALNEYLDSHVQEEISESTYSIYKLFGAYIGATLHGPQEKTQPNVLDVGCGIGRRRPLYMRRLTENVNYFGLDAIDIHAERDYPFICARLEMLSQVDAFHNKFDAFIFGTSLDHFENIDDVVSAVKRLATPGAVVIFWIGLHDVSLVASEEGARALRRIFSTNSVLAVLYRFLRFSLWSFPRMFLVLQRRWTRLMKGQNLDDLHFWYFSEMDLPSVLAKFGEITDISMIPGTNSVFATCRVRP